MPRGVLPTYTRICHTPNILEGYRYLTRCNITYLASQLKMSYHTVRRICTEATKPQARTIDRIGAVLPCITVASWDIWSDRVSKALFAEKQGDIAALLSIEEALLNMLPANKVKPPLHFMPEASIATAKKLHEGSLVNKSASFYLSDIHVTAMDLLSINYGLSKSEMLRNMIDDYLLRSPEVSEALIQHVTGAPAIVQSPPKKEDYIEVSTKQLDAMVPNMPVTEVLHQLTVSLPEEVVSEDTPPPVPEVTEAYAESLELETEHSAPGDLETWAPSSLLTTESNLSDEELEALFGG